MASAAVTSGIGPELESASAAASVAEVSYELLHALYVTLNCMADPSVDPASRRVALDRFVAALPEGDETVLSASGHAITWNGIRIGLDSRSFVAVESILGFFARSAVGGLVLGRDATPAEVDALIRSVATASELAVAADLIRRGVRQASVLPPDESGGTMLLDLAKWQREHALEVSARDEESSGPAASGGLLGVTSDLQSVYVATLLLEHIGEVRLGDPRLAKSVVKCIADALLLHPELIDLLAVIQESDVDLVRHGVSVAVYSVLLGRRIGLPTQLLIELGVAALFHDVGRLDSCGSDDTDHTARGFERFLDFEPCALSLRAMLVARRHHDAVDDEALAEPSLDQVDLFSAIVHTADVFERGLSKEGGCVQGTLAELRADADAGRLPRVLVDALSDVAAVAAASDPV